LWRFGETLVADALDFGGENVAEIGEVLGEPARQTRERHRGKVVPRRRRDEREVGKAAQAIGERAVAMTRVRADVEVDAIGVVRERRGRKQIGGIGDGAIAELMQPGADDRRVRRVGERDPERDAVVAVEDDGGVEVVEVELPAQALGALADEMELVVVRPRHEDAREAEAVFVGRERRPALELDGVCPVDEVQHALGRESDVGNDEVRLFAEAVGEVRVHDRVAAERRLDQRTGEAVVVEDFVREQGVVGDRVG